MCIILIIWPPSVLPRAAPYRYSFLEEAALVFYRFLNNFYVINFKFLNDKLVLLLLSHISKAQSAAKYAA